MFRPHARTCGAISRSLLSVGLIVILLALGIGLFLQLRSRSARIAVTVSTEVGTLIITGENTGAASVTWVCDPEDTRLLRVEGTEVPPERWQQIAALAVPGATATLTGNSSVTEQTDLVDGKQSRTVFAQIQELTVERPGGDPVQWVGLGVGVTEGAAGIGEIYLSVVQVDGVSSTLQFDTEPMVEGKSPSLLERLRGLPDHHVRFPLRVREPVDTTPSPGAADDEEIRRRIERLRNERPERGQIPEPEKQDG